MDGLWKTATFEFTFAVPDDYPYTPPKVTCNDKVRAQRERPRAPPAPALSSLQVYHPNIDLQGAVCLNILRKDWKPVLDTQAIIHGLLFLFLEPNPDDPLNDDAAAVLRKDSKQFARNVDQSLRGMAVNGVQFPKNATYKG